MPNELLSARVCACVEEICVQPDLPCLSKAGGRSPATDKLAHDSPTAGSSKASGQGDDFAGVRAYVTGESQRHIDWKAVARGQPLMTKQFAAENKGAVYLDFSALRFADVEEKLSQLTLWVIEAERARQPYGLRLPDIESLQQLGKRIFTTACAL